MSKHAPGPYKATFQEVVMGSNGFWRIDSDHGLKPHGDLATVWSGFNHSLEEVEATARLFAESPALLEALEWLVGLHCGVGKYPKSEQPYKPYPTEEEFEDAIEFAREKLAKVKGEQYESRRL